MLLSLLLRDDHQPTTLQAKVEGEGELSISIRVSKGTKGGVDQLEEGSKSKSWEVEEGTRLLLHCRKEFEVEKNQSKECNRVEVFQDRKKPTKQRRDLHCIEGDSS